MGKTTDRLKALVRWPRRKPTPLEEKQTSRWEGEGGALHPEETPNDAPDTPDAPR